MEEGGPSQTARRVAAHRLDFTRVPADYGDPAADQALAVDVAAGHRAPANRMHDHLAARTSFFDRVVVGALDRGMRQVVIGAAGYDGRAFRYAKPGVRWFEVDHLATQRDKLERLERLGLDASHVRFVEADFTRDPVADRLLAAGFDPEAPGLFLLEGVAVYLEPAVLENVLRQFRQVSAPGSRLAISVSLSRPRGDPARARFQATVAALGEPARSTFEAGEAEALLAWTGWHLVAARDDDQHAAARDDDQQAAARDDDQQAAARRERLRAVGLLLAGAGPATAAPPQARRRRDPAARPPGADRHLQGGRQVGTGHPDPGWPGGRRAGPGRQPRQGRPAHRPGPRRAARLPRANRRDRAALARALHPGRDRRPPGLARTTGRR